MLLLSIIVIATIYAAYSYWLKQEEKAKQQKLREREEPFAFMLRRQRRMLTYIVSYQNEKMTVIKPFSQPGVAMYYLAKLQQEGIPANLKTIMVRTIEQRRTDKPWNLR